MKAKTKAKFPWQEIRLSNYGFIRQAKTKAKGKAFPEEKILAQCSVCVKPLSRRYDNVVILHQNTVLAEFCSIRCYHDILIIDPGKGENIK